MTNPFDPNYKSQIVPPKDGRKKGHNRPATEAARKGMEALLPETKNRPRHIRRSK